MSMPIRIIENENAENEGPAFIPAMDDNDHTIITAGIMAGDAVMHETVFGTLNDLATAAVREHMTITVSPDTQIDGFGRIFEYICKINDQDHQIRELTSRIQEIAGQNQILIHDMRDLQARVAMMDATMPHHG